MLGDDDDDDDGDGERWGYMTHLVNKQNFG